MGAAQEEIAPTPQVEGDDPGTGEIEDPTHEDSGNGSMEELDQALHNMPIIVNYIKDYIYCLQCIWCAVGI